jgi:putative ABC transport system permease protein
MPTRLVKRNSSRFQSDHQRGYFWRNTITSSRGSVFQVPYASLLVIVVLAALAGMVAAVGPGRRAARLDVLRAVVSE